jgi:hypothetical protein
MKIKYCHIMLEGKNKPDKIETLEIPLEKIPMDILEIINHKQCFSQSRVFEAKGLGVPEEYEKLQVIDETGCRIFEYFNKGIYYMTQCGDDYRPVYKVFAHLTTLSR